MTVVYVPPSSVSLAWDAPPYEKQNGRIHHYNVKIIDIETEEVFEFTSNYTNITVNDLLPFHNYTCIVSAETVGDGPPSDEIFFALPELRKFICISIAQLQVLAINTCLQHLIVPQ